MNFKRFDVVVVPFPFTDSSATRLRPALIVSDDKTFNTPCGHSVMAMITSAAHSTWPLDTMIRDLAAAGLPAASMVRMKLFTLDHRFIRRVAGHLAPADRKAIQAALAALLGK